MYLHIKHRYAWDKLFINDSIPLAITTIAEQGFKRLKKNETVLEYWKLLFGEKNKAEAIKLLARIQRAKDYDFKQFQKFATRMYPS